jgi:hypothetical protein
MNLVILQFFYQKINWYIIKVVLSIRNSKDEVFTRIFLAIYLLKSLNGFQDSFVNGRFTLALNVAGLLNIFF